MASFLASAAARFGANHGPTALLSAAASTAVAAFAVPSTRADGDAGVHCDSRAATVRCTTMCEAQEGVKVAKDPPALARAKLRTRMTQVGRFSLISETRSNPSIPCIVLGVTGKPLLPKDLRALIEDRGVTERHPRFSVCLNRKGNQFVPAEEPLLESNIRESFYPTVPRTDLLGIVSDSVTRPLEMTKSLWQIRVATGGAIGQSGVISKARAETLRKDFEVAAATKSLRDITDAYSSSIASDGPNNVVPFTKTKRLLTDEPVESMLIFRAHHCMADGVSLAAVFSDLMDEAPEFRMRIQDAMDRFKRKRRSWWKRLQFFLYYWCYGSIRAVLYQISLGVRSFLSADPWKVLKNRYSDRLRKLAFVASSDDNGIDKVDVGTATRSISWAEVTTVDEVKDVARHFSTRSRKLTVNDVFASCVSGAIAKLLAYHRGVSDQGGVGIPELRDMNLVIPVHLQGGVVLPHQGIGNKIGALVCRVPAENAEMTPVERLEKVHDRMSFLKRTPAAVLSYLVAKAFGGVGSNLGGLTPWLFSRAHANASAVLTNVRGPETSMHLDGRTVQSVLGFLPLPPGIPVGVVVTSYAKNITLTISAQPWAVPDADVFLSYVIEEYRLLLDEARRCRSEAGEGREGDE